MVQRIMVKDKGQSIKFSLGGPKINVFAFKKQKAYDAWKS